MLFFLIRHGDPTYMPDALTPLGRRQAEAVGKRLSRFGLDEIYASSAVRAQETARPACEMLKKEMTILDWTNENYAWQDLTVYPEGSDHPFWGFGVPEVAELFQSPEMAALGRKWYTHPFFEGTRFESGYLRIEREARAFFREQGFSFDEEKGMYRVTEKNEKRIALFAHQGFGLAFLSAVLDIPYPKFCTTFDISHTGMTLIQFDTSREYTAARVLTLGNDGHLYGEGLPTRYHNRIDI